MGGCRCTYRNCTVRSDGKTHLFHYPVFDKLRCHQWLINSRRYDFLHLKVSQLKNRCICQHHFADNNFMNDMKDKLKLEAVPTLDGPYSDASKCDYPEIQQNPFGLLYPIAEDIENDEYISDRKANYNLKYADFLTNCELAEPLKDMVGNTQDPEDKAKVTVYTLSKNKLRENSVIDMKPSLDKIEIEIPHIPLQLNNATEAKVNMSVPCEQRKRGQIRIISEKKITEPEKKISVPVSTDLFQKVTPSMILSLNNNNNKRNIKVKNPTPPVLPVILKSNNGNKNSEVNNMTPQLSPKIQNLNIEKQGSQEDNVAPRGSSKSLNRNNEKHYSEVNCVTTQHSKENEQSATEISTTRKPSQFEFKVEMNESIPPVPKITHEQKTTKLPIGNKKISAERIAVINEKRKFNMKLRDIIEARLNSLDEEDVAKIKPSIQNTTAKSRSETVASSLSKDTSLPSHSEYVVSYLEARMKRMENLLLNKIDQNTNKITELKKTLHPQKKDPLISSMSTRSTKLHGEAHKRFLYKEISQFLSPETNSLLYEELFIDKYKPNSDPQPPKKRRQR